MCVFFANAKTNNHLFYIVMWLRSYGASSSLLLLYFGKAQGIKEASCHIGIAIRLGKFRRTCTPSPLTRLLNWIMCPCPPQPCWLIGMLEIIKIWDKKLEIKKFKFKCSKIFKSPNYETNKNENWISFSRCHEKIHYSLLSIPLF